MSELLKGSIDYKFNMQALHDMEDVIPMTRSERYHLRKWAKDGNDIESNPWNAVDEYGFPLNFLRAYRLEMGYSAGPWDFWKGPEHELDWNFSKHCFEFPDEY